MRFVRKPKEGQYSYVFVLLLDSVSRLCTISFSNVWNSFGICNFCFICLLFLLSVQFATILIPFIIQLFLNLPPNYWFIWLTAHLKSSMKENMYPNVVTHRQKVLIALFIVYQRRPSVTFSHTYSVNFIHIRNSVPFERICAGFFAHIRRLKKY